LCIAMRSIYCTILRIISALELRPSYVAIHESIQTFVLYRITARATEILYSHPICLLFTYGLTTLCDIKRTEQVRVAVKI
jgi:hypothetical protein